MFCAFPVSHWKPRSAAAALASGRSATAQGSGAGSDYTIGLTGAAAASGIYLLAVISDQGGTSSPAISGGSAWTQLTGSSTGRTAWIKKCGGSEPSTYTVSYAGSAKADGSVAALFEITGPPAGTGNPDAQAHVTNTGTPNSATSSAASDMAILLVANADGSAPSQFTSAPSGYTLKDRLDLSPSGGNPVCVAVSYKLSIGSGTISPGAWGSPGTSASNLWTVLLKL